SRGTVIEAGSAQHSEELMRADRRPARAPAADDAIAGKYGNSRGPRWHLCLWRSPLQPGQEFPDSYYSVTEFTEVSRFFHTIFTKFSGSFHFAPTSAFC